MFCSLFHIFHVHSSHVLWIMSTKQLVGNVILWNKEVMLHLPFNWLMINIHVMSWTLRKCRPVFSGYCLTFLRTESSAAFWPRALQPLRGTLVWFRCKGSHGIQANESMLCLFWFARTREHLWHFKFCHLSRCVRSQRQKFPVFAGLCCRVTRQRCVADNKSFMDFWPS